MYLPKILILGATGNVGHAVIQQLVQREAACELFAGVRDLEKGKLFLGEYTQLQYRHFDFKDPRSFEAALQNIDRVFLMRPPSIADVPRYFAPLVNALKAAGTKLVVFLSVHGAERSRFIPHHKIERLIEQQGLAHVFIRPSYFMQNLTTTLYQDIRDRRRIILPAGNALFNWIDVQDVAKVIALVLLTPQLHLNKSYELTGSENLNFYQVTEILNRFLRWPIRYRAMNPIFFYWRKRRENYPKDYLFVLTLLHVLPRFMKEPLISDDYFVLTGESPSLLQDFAKREAHLLNVKGNDV
jgi:uncharacterized protein YbjT (DUF2867 family)